MLLEKLFRTRKDDIELNCINIANYSVNIHRNIQAQRTYTETVEYELY